MNSTTSLVAKQYRLNQWAEQIRDCQNRLEGMTVTEWCSLHGITKANYYYRLRQVRKACLETIPEEQLSQSIVPVPREIMVPAAEAHPASGVDISVKRILHPCNRKHLSGAVDQSAEGGCPC